ncbi:PilZ domain-containing protein [Neptunomonas antarctica]|uniref:PilZ domain-containing protein n=1 Tax=Neptunomonas antarctica TaxID=619304 RepID=A0A1N7LQX8_9GAMM|nr:PilZ domain-containing protein [Neptunomonas antarctica]SIS76247.1 PilZ domain-containing protein [Neptunomonas antarctica]
MKQERRQFYRVEKNVALEIQPITANEVEHSIQPTQFDVSPYFELLSEVQNIDKQQADLLAQLSDSHPLLAQLFCLQTEKLDLITRTLATSSLKIEKLTKQSINLSEGGMQFTTTTPYQIDDFLAIKLIFQEPLTGVLLYGKVQRIIKNPNDSEVAISFYRMPENCRMLIAQRVIKTQPTHSVAVET